jgi:regulation of enolase protein 1 (concanavalin A-like superfamily)
MCNRATRERCISIKRIPLENGDWLNPPLSADLVGSEFIITAKEKTDFWQKTSYGFIHNSGHALLNDFPEESSLEASWILDYKHQFDHAGLMVYSNETNWIKAGVEFADGLPQLGAVVTRGISDWSVAPVPTWMDKEVTIRFSRSGDALTIRAKCGGDWQFVRLAPLDQNLKWRAGIFCASPLRAGLQVKFTSLSAGAPDSSLH